MTLRLAFFYAAVFLAIGVLLPFWPLWLRSRGMDAAEIGLLLSAGMWVRAISNPLVAQAADRSGRPDQAIRALAWAALAGHALFLFADGFWPLLAVTVLATMAFSALLPIGDAVTMLKVGEGRLDYGRVRLWGSLTFIVAASAGGALIAGRPAALILAMVLGAMALTVAAGHLIPRARTAPARHSAPLAALLRDRRFLLFLAAASLLQASHGVYYGFATLHWQAAGLGEAVIGALWAEGVIAEIVLFSVSGRAVARFGPLGLLALAAAAGAVRWTVLGLTTEIAALVAVQGLHALTFGATHLAAMHFIARQVPAAFAATAQSLYSSTAMGIAMGISMMISGRLYAAFAGEAFFAMTAVSLGGGALVAALACGRNRRARNHRSDTRR